MNKNKLSQTKLHYRLHKSGKLWITTTIATALMGIGISHTAHADTNIDHNSINTTQSNQTNQSDKTQPNTAESNASNTTNIASSTNDNSVSSNASVSANNNNSAGTSNASSNATLQNVPNTIVPNNPELSKITKYYDHYDKAHHVIQNKFALQKTIKTSTGQNINPNQKGLTISKLTQRKNKTNITAKLKNKVVHIKTTNDAIKPLYYTHGELSQQLSSTVNFNVLTTQNTKAYHTAKTKGDHIQLTKNTKVLVKRMVVYHQIPKFELANGTYITANRFYTDLIQNPVIINSHQVVPTNPATVQPQSQSNVNTSVYNSNATQSSGLSPLAQSIYNSYEATSSSTSLTIPTNPTTYQNPLQIMNSLIADNHPYSNFNIPTNVNSLSYVSSSAASSIASSVASFTNASDTSAADKSIANLRSSMAASYAHASSQAASVYKSATDSAINSLNQSFATSANQASVATSNSNDIIKQNLIQSLATSYNTQSKAAASDFSNQLNSVNASLTSSYADISNATQNSYQAIEQSLQSSYTNNESVSANSYNQALNSLASSYANVSNVNQSSYQAITSSLKDSYTNNSNQATTSYSNVIKSLATSYANQQLVDSQSADLAKSNAVTSLQNSYQAASNTANSTYQQSLASLQASANSQMASLSNSANSAIASTHNSDQDSASNQANSLSNSANNQLNSMTTSVTNSLNNSYNSTAQSMQNSYSAAVSNAIAGKTQLAHSNSVTDFTLDQARYNPNQMVDLQYTLSNAASDPSENNVTVKIYSQDQVIASIDKTQLVPGHQSQTFNLQWQAPNQDYTGYWMAIEVDGKIQKVGAIDVSSDINKFPRYGAVTQFTPGTDNSAIIQQMKQWNINVLEYYDAYQNPQTPINYDNPSANYTQTWAPWLSDADKTKSGQVVMDTVADAHKNGIDSMFYNMIYAITGNATDQNYLASIGVKPEWLLYHADGAQKDQLFQFPMASYLNDKTSAEYLNAVQTYLDIENPEVVDWIVSRMRPVLEKMNFDGWHGDTIGNNDLMYSKNPDGSIKNEYRVGDELGNFANAVKERLTNKKFAVNTVSGYGEDNVAKSNTDFDYSETWTGTYNDVVSEIKRVAAESGKSLVIPGYLQEQLSKDHPGANFNPNAVLLFDAMVYAAGGSRMEVVDGQHLLVGEFFPSKALNVTDDLKNQMNNYQTFITAYENLLRDGQSDNYHGIELYDNNGNSITRSDNASPNSVYAFGRSSSNSETVQLINMLGVTSDKWQDTDSSRQQPTEIDNFHVHYYPSQKYQPGSSNEAHHVYLASPDGANANQSIEVPFTWKTNQYGYYMDISVPSLQRWDMLYLK